MHQRLRCAGHGNVDLICPVGRRFGKVSRRGGRRRVGHCSDTAPKSVASGAECVSVCPLYGTSLDWRHEAGPSTANVNCSASSVWMTTSRP